MRLDFAGVPDMNFDPVPAGVYTLEFTDYTEGEVQSESSKNFGATKYNWTFEIVDCEKEEYNGRKVWDNVTIAETSLWRLKAFIKAFGVEVPDEGEFDFEPDDFIGAQIQARVGVEPERQVGDRTYDSKNTIKKFMVPAHVE